MGIATHVRRYNPRLWFQFAFLRYRHHPRGHDLHLLRQVVPHGKMAVDVGSSIGFYSLALSRMVPRVVAFEANPEVAAFAAKVAPRNVEVMNVALSNASKRTMLRIPVNARGHTVDDLATVEERNALTADRIVTVEVPTRRLDYYDFADCGFIKIDVEGHEEAVLEGAQHLLETTRPTLMIELVDDHNPGIIARVTARLSRLSYDGYFMSRAGWKPIAEFRADRLQNLQGALALPPRQRRHAEYIANFVFVPREAPPPAIMQLERPATGADQ